MGIKRIIIVTVLPLFLVTLLSSQSLVELAKKEKERRAKLKEKKSILVTNADLKNLKKKAGVSVPESQLAAIRRRAAQSPVQRQPSGDIDRESPGRLAELEANWKKADEYVELLTLKINGLQQKFYTFRDWTLRDSIQREIRDTYQKLQKAKVEAKKAKEEYEKIRSRRSKNGVSP